MAAAVLVSGLGGLGVTKGLALLPALASAPSVTSCSYDSPHAFSRGRKLCRASSETRRCGTRLSAARFLEFTACKSRLRKRRRGGKGSDSDSDDGGSSGGSGWSSFGSGGGGHGDFGGYSGGGGWDEAAYEAGWLWPLLVAYAILHSANMGFRELGRELGPVRSSLRAYTASGTGRVSRSASAC